MSTISQAKNKNIKKATNCEDLDTVLSKIKQIDDTCSYTKCKTRTSDFAIHCKYCNLRFCTTHGLQEIHGCGEAVRKDEKQKFLHPPAKLSSEKHSQASTKLALKIKQKELERKSKQALNKEKKK